jgi:hypothetical protein
LRFIDRARPSFLYGNRLLGRLLDPCSSVVGFTSIKVQRLLALAVSCLAEGECYLEVGTYQGKTLVSALLGNPQTQAYACDNFSEAWRDNTPATLEANLRQFRLESRVKFFNADFHAVMNERNIHRPVGVYLYDAAHDLANQIDAIRLAEPILADPALVIVDDWRFESDSPSYAKAGTWSAIEESRNQWKLLYELPARWNGDRAMWWNGVAVFSFSRRKD